MESQANADDINDYFAYLNNETGQYYYFNNTTKDCSYNFPDKGFIFNPVTRERLYIPPGNWRPDYEPGTKTVGRNVEFPPRKKLKSIIEVPESVTNFRKAKLASMNTAPARMDVTNLSSNFNREAFLKSIEQFQIPEYARKFFKVRRGICFLKNIPPESIVHFRTKPLSSPLLKSLPRALHKVALTCFKYVMGFMGQIAADRNLGSPEGCVTELVKELHANPPLRDEVYAYLICQTTEVPDEETCVKAWKLFLIIATIFPSSRDFETWIQSHISRAALNTPFEAVSDLAQFTYIRFESRCSLNKAMPPTSYDSKSLMEIADDLNTTTAQFGVSLYEIMWQQKEIYPNLKIPYFLYYMTRLIVSKGGYNYEGLFRISGNIRIVNQLAMAANESLESVKDADIHDLTSLFKMWFRELPNSLIPEKYLSNFLSAVEEGKCVEFLQTLPNTHLASLSYLIGFLQECATQERMTQMGAGNLAIVFGPNIYSTSESSPEKFHEYSKLCTESLLWLIENYDASRFYPIFLD